MSERHVLILDLKNDDKLISLYEEYHREVWPEVLSNLEENGVQQMEIYRFQTRLVMIMDVDGAFSFEKMKKAEMKNPSIQKWEGLMWQFQKPLPGMNKNEKWKLANKIFTLY